VKEERLHLSKAAQLDVGEAAGGLVSAEDLLDAFADDLADGVAGMPLGALVDRRRAGLAVLAVDR